MIDHLLAFDSEVTAQSDSIVGAYWVSDSQGAGTWRSDVCIPGVFVWAPTLDIITTDPITGFSIVNHTPYDNQWRIVIALPQQDMVLSGSAACELVADRDAANKGLPFILQSNLSDSDLEQLLLEPVFAGSNYPFGKFN